MVQVLALVPASGLDAVVIAVELALEQAPLSGRVSFELVVNVLSRMRSVQMPPKIDTSLQLATPCWPMRRAMTGCVRHCNRGRPLMRDLIVELKQLRPHGTAAGWAELLEQGNIEVTS